MSFPCALCPAGNCCLKDTILRFVDFLLIMKLAKEVYNVSCKALMKLLFSKRVKQPYICLSKGFVEKYLKAPKITRHKVFAAIYFFHEEKLTFPCSLTSQCHSLLNDLSLEVGNISKRHQLSKSRHLNKKLYI